MTAEEFARRLADCTRTVYRGTRSVGLRTEYRPMCALIEQDRAAAKLEVLEELKDAMVNEMARVNRGRGFKNTDEIHGILPEQLRLLCAKYAKAGGGR